MTPLNCVITFARILLSLQLGDRAKKFVTLIERTATLLKHNMRDLLDRNQLDRKTFEVHPEPAEPHKVIGEVVDIMTPQAESKGVIMKFDYPDVYFYDGRKFMIDTPRLQQVIINLCSNAIKFSETGN